MPLAEIPPWFAFYMPREARKTGSASIRYIVVRAILYGDGAAASAYYMLSRGDAFLKLRGVRVVPGKWGRRRSCENSEGA